MIGGKGAFADWNEDFSSLLEAVRLGVDIDTGASDERAIALAFICMVVAKKIGVGAGLDPVATDEDVRTAGSADDDVGL